MHLVQRGVWDKRDIIVLHGADAFTARTVCVAAPYATIGVCDEPFPDMITTLRAFGKDDAEHVVYRVMAVGFGAGASGADGWLKAPCAQPSERIIGVRPPRGHHAIKPDTIISIDGWACENDHAARVRFVSEALDGERLLILACSSDSPARKYVEAITGWTVESGPLDEPREQRHGGLLVVGYDVSSDVLAEHKAVVTGYCVALAIDALKPF